MGFQLLALTGGLLMLFLIILNILIGLKIIKAGLGIHKGIAVLILIFGLLHATGGILNFLGLPAK